MSNVNPIEVKNLRFSYESVPAIEHADFTIKDREFVCMVGPNGGGKTTLLKLILGLLEPQQGSISIFGKKPSVGRKQIGYLSQQAHLDPQFPVTACDVVLMGRLGNTRLFGGYTEKDRALALETLEQVGLEKWAHHSFSKLSGGQRQRVLIARALVLDPKMLVLDEPTASLDDYMEQELYELLKELNKKLTIMIVTHDISFVSSCINNVVCVNKQVHIHPTSKVDKDIIFNMYGDDVRVIRHDQGTAHD